jgi:glutamyl-tRNA synthetase
MAINNFFSTLGTSKAIMPYKDLTSLVEHFEVSSFSKSPTSYLPSELDRLNHKLIISLEFEEVRGRLLALGIAEIDKDFWLAIRPNLQKLSDIRDWWKVCYCPERLENLDRDFLEIAADLLPAGEITSDSWAIWIANIQEATKKKGKEIFLPLRLALTGMDHGFELKNLLPLIGREEIINRLTFLSN